MNAHPVQLFAPMFQWLDALIRDHGDQLYMALVYISVPLIVWILCGGLRRKLYRGKSAPHVPPVIVVHIPIGRPAPESETFNPFPPYQEPPHCDHDDCYLD